MPVVRGGDHDGVHVLIIDDFAEILVLGEFGELLGHHLAAPFQVTGEDIAERDRLNVVALEHEAEVSPAHTARADVAGQDFFVRAHDRGGQNGFVDGRVGPFGGNPCQGPDSGGLHEGTAVKALFLCWPSLLFRRLTLSQISMNGCLDRLIAKGYRARRQSTSGMPDRGIWYLFQETESILRTTYGEIAPPPKHWIY